MIPLVSSLLLLDGPPEPSTGTGMFSISLSVSLSLPLPPTDERPLSTDVHKLKCVVNYS